MLSSVPVRGPSPRCCCCSSPALRCGAAAATTTAARRRRRASSSTPTASARTSLGEFKDAGSENPGTAKEVADANKVLADVYERFGKRIGEVRLPDAGAGADAGRPGLRRLGTRSKPLLDGLRSTADEFLAAAQGSDARALTTAGNDLRIALDRFRASRAASDLLAVPIGLNLCGNLD